MLQGGGVPLDSLGSLIAVLAAALVLLITYLLFEAFETVGFTPIETVVILFVSPLLFILIPPITLFMNGELGIGAMDRENTICTSVMAPDQR